MNLLVLSINYAPEPTGFAPHTTALCEYLASQRHAVTVMTGFPFAPYWARYPAYQGKFIERKRLNGVDVIRLTHFMPRVPGKMSQRLLMEGTFCALAAVNALLQFRSSYEAILYVGAQPSMAMLARMIARFHRIPYFVKITDLAAQAATDVGIVKSPTLKKFLSHFEYAAYRHASGAIVLCNAFREALISHGYPSERIRIIRDSVNLDLIRPVSNGDAFRREHGLSSDDFVVLYSGSMGIKQGLTNVVEAARFLKDGHPMIKWVLVGDGELKPTLQKLVAEYELFEQVRLLPLQAENKMSAMFSCADLLLLNQLREVKDTVIPSKLLTYMASGQAVLAAVNSSSQAAALLREAQGGVIVKPQDPSALALAIKQLQANRSALPEMGQRNRKYAEKHFDRRQIVRAQEAFLIKIVNQTHYSSVK